MAHCASRSTSMALLEHPTDHLPRRRIINSHSAEVSKAHLRLLEDPWSDGPVPKELRPYFYVRYVLQDVPLYMSLMKHRHPDSLRFQYTYVSGKRKLRGRTERGMVSSLVRAHPQARAYVAHHKAMYAAFVNYLHATKRVDETGATLYYKQEFYDTHRIGVVDRPPREDRGHRLGVAVSETTRALAALKEKERLSNLERHQKQALENRRLGRYVTSASERFRVECFHEARRRRLSKRSRDTEDEAPSSKRPMVSYASAREHVRLMVNEHLVALHQPNAIKTLWLQNPRGKDREASFMVRTRLAGPRKVARVVRVRLEHHPTLDTRTQWPSVDEDVYNNIALEIAQQVDMRLRQWET